MLVAALAEWSLVTACWCFLRESRARHQAKPCHHMNSSEPGTISQLRKWMLRGDSGHTAIVELWLKLALAGLKPHTQHPALCLTFMEGYMLLCAPPSPTPSLPVPQPLTVSRSPSSHGHQGA